MGKKRLHYIRKSDYLTTGRLIEAVMKYRGLEVQELAELVGEHPMNFYKLLNGRRPITYEMASKLSDALNMSPLIIMESRNIELFNENNN
jgi:plasmid maintenance system antidote protein VapI